MSKQKLNKQLIVASCWFFYLHTYYFHAPIILKSGGLNLLEPSWLVRACAVIALPLPMSVESGLCNGVCLLFVEM